MDQHDGDPKRARADDVHSEGGSVIHGDVHAGRDLIGRDQNVYGDLVEGDQVLGDKVETHLFPRWALVVLVAFLILTPLLVINYGDRVRAYFASLSADTSAIQQGVQDLATAQVPTATPIPPTPTPVAMKGETNIAIALPVVLNGEVDGAVQRFLDVYATELEGEIDQALNKFRQVETRALNFELGIVSVKVTDPERRHELMAAYAREINAHVILYGTLDLAPNPAILQPEFYVHPVLRAAAPEITGPEAFGRTIDIRFSASGADEMEWTTNLREPLAGFGAFLAGVLLFDAGAHDDALAAFRTLYVVDNWANDESRAVLNLWLGTTYAALAAERREDGASSEIDCLAGRERMGAAACARLHYEAARDLDPNYPRAYIGLGNTWLEFGQEQCTPYDRALEEYTLALDAARAATPTEESVQDAALVFPKIHYQVGLAHSRALFDDCGEQEVHRDGASQAFIAALDLYEQAATGEDGVDPMLRDLASRSAYQLGIVHKRLDQQDLALEAFDQVIAIAEFATQREDPWQSIRWEARNQKGAIYLRRYERGDGTAFAPAESALTEVTEAFREQKFGRSFEDEVDIAAAAYYHLGRLYYARASRDDVANPRNQLVDAAAALNQSIEIIDERTLRQPHGLPWISHALLGHTYRHLSEADLAFEAKSLDQYRRVLHAFECGYFASNDVAIEMFAETSHGAALILMARDEAHFAAPLLQSAAAAAELLGRPDILEEATSLLAEIPSSVVDPSLDPYFDLDCAASI